MNKVKRIQQFLEGIEWMFGLNNFERQIVLKNEDEETDDGKIGARIDYQEDYQTIEVSIYPCFFDEKPSKQRKILLHELCHSITIPSKVLSYALCSGELVTREQIRAENERMTSKIENILDGLLQGRLKYARETYSKYLEEPKKKVESK